MRIKNSTNKNKGFTLVELMISISVFTLILVATSAVLVQMGRAYYRSVFTSRTQSVTRSVADNVSRSIQFSGSTIIKSDSPLLIDASNSISAEAICLGATRYTYVIDNIVGSSNVEHALWRDTISTSGACEPLDLTAIPPDNDGSELLGENMRLLMFSVDPVVDSTREYKVRVDIGYGDTDQIEGVDAAGNSIDDLSDGSIVRFRCKPTSLAIQFCAMSSLSTTIARRL